MILKNLKYALCHFHVFIEPLLPAKNQRKVMSQSSQNCVADRPMNGWVDKTEFIEPSSRAGGPNIKHYQLKITKLHYTAILSESKRSGTSFQSLQGV